MARSCECMKQAFTLLLTGESAAMSHLWLLFPVPRSFPSWQLPQGVCGITLAVRPCQSGPYWCHFPIAYHHHHQRVCRRDRRDTSQILVATVPFPSMVQTSIFLKNCCSNNCSNSIVTVQYCYYYYVCFTISATKHGLVQPHILHFPLPLSCFFITGGKDKDKSISMDRKDQHKALITELEIWI